MQRSIFLSTPSARRATLFGGVGDLAAVISIHALREEGDNAAVPLLSVVVYFLSTPSARRATMLFRGLSEPFDISIHALREEGD